MTRHKAKKGPKKGHTSGSLCYFQRGYPSHNDVDLVCSVIILKSGIDSAREQNGRQLANDRCRMYLCPSSQGGIQIRRWRLSLSCRLLSQLWSAIQLPILYSSRPEMQGVECIIEQPPDEHLRLSCSAMHLDEHTNMHVIAIATLGF